MTASLLPLAIRDERFLAFEAVLDRLSELDLSVLAVYDIDNVTPEALYDLADQFNVLGLRGWTLAGNETQRRALIKEAIALHRTAGTPYAVKRAMALVGYPNATITENPGLRFDGSWRFNGTRQFSGVSYGTFVVTLDSQQSLVSADLIKLIVALINEWKNARSSLVDLRIGNISLFSNLQLHDGLWGYNGAQTFDGERNI
ncbi:phage tail protein [Pseudanabaena sp. FACHB-2040]|uniref:phage tail protein n=1 Tax=Pseudanabaena sp. FACHB-2040 TaxID=2692859 RepID=UPI0016896A59|nr:phage tail protein [Pseudanabaena sp. FACHB-2040]MBD2261348.1 phage tail protein [Pseudanabaena sp. FACHB-2040]